MKPVAIIQNCEVESAGSIIKYLRSKEIPFTETHSYRAEKFPDLNEIGAIISLGCPLSMMQYQEHKFLVELFNFKSRAVEKSLAILGICAGAQMLSIVLGGKVTKNKVKEIGIGQINLTEPGHKDIVFDGFEKSFPVFQWHGDTFSIPPGAAHLAKSDDCPHQAYRKDNLVGVQFHLEADSEQVPLWCDTYEDELSGEGLNKTTIVKSFNKHAEQLRVLSFNLLDNFFSLV